MCVGEGEGSFTKVQQVAVLDMKSRVKELCGILTVLHSGKERKEKKRKANKKESALRMKLRYKLKLEGF